MRIIVEFKTDNAAFEDPSETHRVLGRAGEIINAHPDAEPGDSEWLHDRNGNRVGSVEWR